MYEIYLGHDFVEDAHRILQFENLSDANDFANEVLKETGEILAITEEQSNDEYCNE